MNRPQVAYFLSGVLAYFPTGAPTGTLEHGENASTMTSCLHRICSESRGWTLHIPPSEIERGA